MTHTLLSCPACSAQYNIPNSAIPATGRRVKCTACAYSWQVFPAVQQVAEPADMAVLSTQTFDEAPQETPQETPATEQESAALLAQALSRQGIEVDSDFAPKTGFNMPHMFKTAGVAFATVAVVLVVGAIVARATGAELGQAYPSLTPALQALGAHVPVLGEGLVFEDVAVTRSPSNAANLVVVGQWRNRTGHGVVVPNMQAAVVANATDQTPLKTWPIAQKPRVIPAAGVAKFQYELPDAPSDAAHVRLTFVEPFIDKIQ